MTLTRKARGGIGRVTIHGSPAERKIAFNGLLAKHGKALIFNMLDNGDGTTTISKFSRGMLTSMEVVPSSRPPVAPVPRQQFRNTVMSEAWGG